MELDSNFNKIQQNTSTTWYRSFHQPIAPFRSFAGNWWVTLFSQDTLESTAQNFNKDLYVDNGNFQMDLETLGKFRWIHSRFARQGRVPWKTAVDGFLAFMSWCNRNPEGRPPTPRVYILYIYIEIYTFCLNIEMSICLKTTQPCTKLWSWNRTSLGPEVSVCRFAERCLKEDEKREDEDMRKNGKNESNYSWNVVLLMFFVHWSFTTQNLILHIFSPISLPSLIWKLNIVGCMAETGPFWGRRRQWCDGFTNVSSFLGLGSWRNVGNFRNLMYKLCKVKMII